MRNAEELAAQTLKGAADAVEKARLEDRNIFVAAEDEQGGKMPAFHILADEDFIARVVLAVFACLRMQEPRIYRALMRTLMLMSGCSVEDGGEADG